MPRSSPPPSGFDHDVGDACAGVADLVGEEGAEGRRVLHDERSDGQEGQEEHVHLHPISGSKLQFHLFQV